MSPKGRFATVSKRNFPENSAKSFTAKVGKEKFEGFVVRANGRYFAYQNLCQHLPVTLDLQDGKFFSHDKKALQCHMHGALYDPQTGKCFAGPCEGESLIPLNLIEEEERLVVEIPAAKSR